MSEYVCKKIAAALKNDAFYDLLCGHHPYALPDRDGVSPTNRGGLLYSGIYRYFESDNTIKTVFENTLYKLMRGSTYELLTAFEYIWRCKISEQRNTAPFSIDPQCVATLNLAIMGRRSELEHCKDLPEFGATLPSGSWDYVQNIAALYKAEYGRSMWD